MDYDRAIARIYEQLDKDEVENAVMGCVRIARNTKDYLNIAIFVRELYPDQKEVARVIYDDGRQLAKEAQKFAWDRSLDYWLELHTLDYCLNGEEDVEDGDKLNVLRVAAGEIDAKIHQWEKSIADLTVPSGMDPFDSAAFTDRFTHEKARMRLYIDSLQTVKSRLKTRCLNYAIQIEQQLSSQRQSQKLLEDLQNDVNNFFKARSEEIFFKLQKASQLSLSSDPEDASLILAEVRRALKAAADHFYPPVPGKVTCSDGVERELGEEQYLNRLQEFLAARFERSSAVELLHAESDHLAAFIRRLNDLASKGVHAKATLAEAKQGLIGLYFFLFNVSQRLTEDPE